MAVRPLTPLGATRLHRAPEPRRALLSAPDGAQLIALGTTGMLVAPGGVGKSQALVQLALSIASGRNWLGTYRPAVLPGHVYYGSSEESYEELQRRFHHTAALLGIDESVGEYIWIDDHSEEDSTLIQLVDKQTNNKRERVYTRTKFADALHTDLLSAAQSQDAAPRWDEDWGGAFNWRLIILEPAASYMGLQAETDNAAGNQFIRELRTLTTLPGKPAVILAHHANKGALTPAGLTNQSVARGSSALTDGVRWQANLDRVYSKGELIPERVTFHVTKWNYGPIPAPLDLQRCAHGVLLPWEDE